MVCALLLSSCERSPVSDELERLVRPLVRDITALKLASIEGSNSVSPVQSRFGGPAYAEEGEGWPECGGCKNPLTFIMQVNLQECRHPELTGIGLFAFFYCWSCSPWGLDGDPPASWALRLYLDPSPARARTIRPAPRSQGSSPVTVPCLVTPMKATSMPSWEGLELWSKEASQLSASLHPDEPWAAYSVLEEKFGNELDHQTKLGGHPHWIQSEATPECQRCAKRMTLLAQVDSEECAGIMWGDVGTVYLFLCKDHTHEVRLELQCF